MADEGTRVVCMDVIYSLSCQSGIVKEAMTLPFLCFVNWWRRGWQCCERKYHSGFMVDKRDCLALFLSHLKILLLYTPVRFSLFWLEPAWAPRRDEFSF